jgi:hypothetical protein
MRYVYCLGFFNMLPLVFAVMTGYPPSSFFNRREFVHMRVLQPFHEEDVNPFKSLNFSVGLSFPDEDDYRRFPTDFLGALVCVEFLKTCTRVFPANKLVETRSWKPVTVFSLTPGTLNNVEACDSVTRKCTVQVILLPNANAEVDVLASTNVTFFVVPPTTVESWQNVDEAVVPSQDLPAIDDVKYPAVLKFEYPQSGMFLNTSKVLLSMEMYVDNMETFNKENPINVMSCFELEKINDPGLPPGRNARHFCADIEEANIKLSGLGDGLYHLTTWLIRNDTASVVVLSGNVTVAFTVVCRCNNEDTWYVEGPTPPLVPYAERYRNLPTGHTAIPWLESGAQLLLPPYSLLPPLVSNAWQREKRNVILVIGVKIAANAFEYRRALRETWFRREHWRRDVAMWFVIGTPDANTPSAVLDALIQESRVHGDMLLGPHPRFMKANLPFPWVLFNVSDSYFTLVEKSVTFMTFATRTYNFQYLFMCDEDIMLRVDQLLKALAGQGPRYRFFAGQVWEKHYGRAIRPIRDPESKNYVSFQHWKMRDLPPVAIGPHYLMSSDCIDFIVKNKDSLRGVGTLEDVSMAVWMFSAGVQPEHVKWFSNAKNFECSSGYVSFADLTPDGIRLLYQNLQSGKEMCDGYKDLQKNKMKK